MAEVGHKTQSIRLSRGVSLYKQPQSKGRGSPNWYARVYMPIDGRATHTTSTGTTDTRLAEKIAFAFYGDCLVRSRILNGTLPPTPIGKKGELRFDRIADQFLDRLESEAGDDRRKFRNLIDYRGAILGKGGLATYFGKADINTVTKERISDYLQFQIATSQKGILAAATQKRTLVALNVILKYAYGRGLLKTLPSSPKIRMQDNPRPWFERREYDQLHRTARRLAAKAKAEGDLANYEKWTELSDFIIFMVNTFLRPSEWSSLQNRHIDLVEAEHRYLEIAVIEGKTGDRKAISMEEAIPIYKRILSRNGNDPEAFLFKPHYPNRQTAKERMRDDFENLLNLTGLARNSLGKKRTLYSLRHTALMFRMTEGNVNTFNLAKNAGTSIEMLQRFYLRDLTPKHVIKNLQS